MKEEAHEQEWSMVVVNIEEKKKSGTPYKNFNALC
jgi:hypothetical protein